MRCRMSRASTSILTVITLLVVVMIAMYGFGMYCPVLVYGALRDIKGRSVESRLGICIDSVYCISTLLYHNYSRLL